MCKKSALIIHDVGFSGDIVIAIDLASVDEERVVEFEYTPAFVNMSKYMNTRLHLLDPLQK